MNKGVLFVSNDAASDRLPGAPRHRAGQHRPLRTAVRAWHESNGI